ncbi:IgGFc-binding protein-like [Gigantopelta aegis]|uniref:IgGFc-binding protein-like n=1 Tax=Gigantopelta aegis TaxID=1735272 RepID=UPI001B88AA70|nr:IgGFc-binding protein-like [Gigantopelta aegis]
MEHLVQVLAYENTMVVTRLFVIIFLMQIDSSHGAGGYSKGKEFMLTFLYNHQDVQSKEEHNFIFVTSEQDGWVALEQYVPGESHAHIQNYSLTADVAQTIVLSDHSEMSPASGVEKKGIFVFSNVDVVVSAINEDLQGTSEDAFLVLPVKSLSRDYLVPTVWSNPLMGVVALLPNTHVEVRVKTNCDISYKLDVLSHGSTINVTLDHADVFQLYAVYQTGSNCDMGGTEVIADKPVAVFSGSSCAELGKGCDHLMQQVIPVELWGRRFIVPDIFDVDPWEVRILSTQSSYVSVVEHERDGTTHTVNREIERGVPVDYQIPDGTLVEIFANHDIMVTQYSTASAPFIIPIPSVDQYAWNTTITTMDNPTSHNFISFVNVVVKTQSIHTFILDGATISNSSWQAVRDLGYSIATVPVTQGTHKLSCEHPFFATVYGYDGTGSYGYLAGYHFNKFPSENLSVLDTVVRPTQGPVTTQAPCEDSPGVNCPVLAASLRICKTPSTAKRYCIKYCGLCPVSCTEPGCGFGK